MRVRPVTPNVLISSRNFSTLQSLTVEITGNESKVEKFLELMSTFGVTGLTRTGKVALQRK